MELLVRFMTVDRTETEEISAAGSPRDEASDKRLMDQEDVKAAWAKVCDEIFQRCAAKFDNQDKCGVSAVGAEEALDARCLRIHQKR